MADIRISAVNSIQAIDQWLKVLAGNLTGSNVIGYRQQRVEFADVLTKHVEAESDRAGVESTLSPIDLPVGGMKIKATKTDFSQGSLQSTGQAADLAIQGDGFFMLSKSPKPGGMGDLVFTRNGSFHFDFFQEPIDPGAGLGDGATRGRFRLVNQDGLFVMGYKTTNPKAYEKNVVANLPGSPNPPRETSGPSGTTRDDLGGISFLGFNPPTGDPIGANPEGYTLAPIEIPFQNDPNPKNPAGPLNVNNNFQATFNSLGWVQNNSDAPINEKGEKLVMFVGLAKFADPTGLTKLKGGSEFGWNNTVGQTFTGVAGFGNGTIGKNNTLNPGSLETSNSSVNTTLPELTIAQKSFTANVKIVQVGNNLIDDVNSLIR